jgi:hypothetical protein
MSNQVYANNMEVSCKAASGKTICNFPDVCMTPPQTPATPPGVPIPYPNTGMASDCTSGSSSVKISNQEVMLKDKSYFKRSMGDEAGCAPKKGVVTSQNMGKVYFAMWSMDVKVEGENVTRMGDITTHNHGSCPSNTKPQPYIDEATAGLPAACQDEKDAIEKACNEDKEKPCPGKLSQPKAPDRATADAATKSAKSSSCAQALKCFLRPYKSKHKGKDVNSCCDGQTGHHIPPWSTTKSIKKAASGVTKNTALCICLEGWNHSIGSHGRHHHGINYLLKKVSEAASSVVTALTGKKKGQYQAKMRDHIKVTAQVTAAQTGCSVKCIEEQLNKQYDKDLDKDATHNASTTGGESYGALDPTDPDALNTAAKKMAQAAKRGMG